MRDSILQATKQTATMAASTPAGDSFLQREALDDGDADEQVTDSKRTWNPDVLLELVHIWRRVELAHAELGRVAKAQLVYDEFSEKVDRGSDAYDANANGSAGAPKRSRKAVEDKLYTMKQMYRFILEMNRDFVRQRVGGASNSYLRSWFDLTKEERRAVRSLHGIRIPNISQEVFHVLDSVLHAGSATAIKKKSKATHGSLQLQSLPPLASPVSSFNNSSNNDGEATADAPQQDLVLDGKRNWSADATMELARIWSDIQRASPNLRGAQLGEMVYNVFKARAGGLLSRSRKAVEEKMQSMKEMYRFIRHCDDTRGARGGDTGGIVMAPTWFELTKAERRQLRKANKIRVTNLSREEFDQVHAIMSIRAEAEAALVDLSNPPHISSVNANSVVPQASQQPTEQQQPVQANESNQSITGVLGAVQRVITQELRVDSSVERGGGPQSTDDNAATNRNRAQKRPRTDEVTTASGGTRSQPSASYDGGVKPTTRIDYATAEFLLEKIRVLQEGDRAERRRQHEEHMTAIKELTELVRSQQR